MSAPWVKVFSILLLLIAIPANGQPDPQTSLQFLVYGASGKIGRQVVTEALSRGHRVTAVSRDPSRIERQHERLKVVRGDVLDSDSLHSLIPGNDIVVISVSGSLPGPKTAESSIPYQGIRTVVGAVQSMPGESVRVLHVGGSGSLMLPNGKRFADTIPKIFIPKSLEVEIAGQIEALEFLRSVDDVSWTYITPPENFTNGKRTGEYRIGGDLKLEDEQSRSRVSRADFAVALVDEAEQGRYIRQRFSVAY